MCIMQQGSSASTWTHVNRNTFCVLQTPLCKYRLSADTGCSQSGNVNLVFNSLKTLFHHYLDTIIYYNRVRTAAGLGV